MLVNSRVTNSDLEPSRAMKTPFVEQETKSYAASWRISLLIISWKHTVLATVEEKLLIRFDFLLHLI